MKAVVQRVIDAAVTVDGVLKGAIHSGLLVYLGVARDDTPRDADWLAEKIPHLRIFDDENGKMNLSLIDIVNQQKEVVNDMGVNHENNMVNTLVNHQNNEVNTIPKDLTQRRKVTKVAKEDRDLTDQSGVLAVSQFTLLGDARKGRRPTWDKAAPPDRARELYQYFIEKVREKVPCSSGEFQAHMQVGYTNDGPVTILLDSGE